MSKTKPVSSLAAKKKETKVRDKKKGANTKFSEKDSAFKAPKITRHPSSAQLIEGKNARFMVVAKGIPRPKFKWMHNGTRIDGAVGNVLVIPKIRKRHSGGYSCEVSNIAGTEVSRVANLTVTAVAEEELEFESIIISPDAVNVEAGKEILMRVTVVPEELENKARFQWYKDERKVKGARKSFLRIRGAKEKYVGEYSVKATINDVVHLSAPISVKLLPAVPQAQLSIEDDPLANQHLNMQADPDGTPYGFKPMPGASVAAISTLPESDSTLLLERAEKTLLSLNSLSRANAHASNLAENESTLLLEKAEATLMDLRVDLAASSGDATIELPSVAESAAMELELSPANADPVTIEEVVLESSQPAIVEDLVVERSQAAMVEGLNLENSQPAMIEDLIVEGSQPAMIEEGSQPAMIEDLIVEGSQPAMVEDVDNTLHIIGLDETKESTVSAIVEMDAITIDDMEVNADSDICADDDAVDPIVFDSSENIEAAPEPVVVPAEVLAQRRRRRVLIRQAEYLQAALTHTLIIRQAA